MRTVRTVLIVLLLVGCSDGEESSGETRDTGTNVEDVVDSGTGEPPAEDTAVSETSPEWDGGGDADAAEDTAADSGDVGDIDAYTEFDNQSACSTEREGKDAVFVFHETEGSENVRGCVRIRLLRGAEDEAPELSTPADWGYTGAQVKDERCTSLFLSDDGAVEAEGATGSIEIEENNSGDIEQVESDVLLRFPDDEANPYGEYIAIRGVNEYVASTCPLDNR